jgi:lysyl-tRNA synthetase class II
MAQIVHPIANGANCDCQMSPLAQLNGDMMVRIAIEL